MKILMISTTPPVGQTLRRGLEALGHRVVIVDDPSPFDDAMKPEYHMSWSVSLRRRFGDGYDVVHVHSPNLKKFLLAYPYVKRGVPMVCHWHGSDLRIWTRSFPVRRWFMRHAKMNLYSTNDLAWWVHGRKMLLNCPVDCEMFKPGEEPGHGTVVFNGGGKAFNDHRILHENMPEYLQGYSMADIHNAMGLDDTLLSIIALECSACGLKVVQFPWMTRDWVLENASLPVIAKKVEQVYEGLSRNG